MARPILRYTGDEELDERHKRAEEARRRVLSGESIQQQQNNRPVLTYKAPDPVMVEPGGMNLFESVKNFEQTHPKPQTKPQEKQKSKGVAVAMADTLGGALDGLTFGATKPLTDKIRDYVSDDNDATKVSPQRRTEIEAKNGDIIGETIGTLGSGAGAFRAATRLAAPLTRALPGLAERGVAPLASRLSPTAGALTRVGAQKVGQGLGMAATGAATGALFQAPREVTEEAYGVNNQTFGERAKDIGVSAALGAALDPALEIFSGAIGKSAQSVMERWKKPVVESAPQQAGPTLGLPLGRRDAAAARSVNAPGTEAISPEYTFSLPRGNTERVRNVESTRNDLNVIDDEIRQLEQKYEKAVVDEYHYLKTSMENRDGVIQGGVVNDPVTGAVIDRYGRQSNNPRWYQNFFAKNNRKPSNKELYQLAKERVDGGFADEGGQYAGWRAENGYDENMNSLQQVRDQINQSLRELDPAINVTDNPLVSNEMTFDATQKRTSNRPRKEEQTSSEVEATPKTNSDDLPASPVDAEDVADDIELPQSDEVAPRVRDRVSSFADDLINSAKAELAASRNRLSSNPVDVYAKYAKLGAGYMLKGSVKLADFTEQLVKDFGENIRPHAKAIFKQAKEQYKQVQRQIETEELGVGFDSTKLKDLSNLNLNTADVYRNFRKVFGSNYGSVKKAVLDPFDAAKGSYAQEQKTMTDTLYRDIVKGLGIRKGSKESALVQKFGEKQITLEELKQQAPREWQKIVRADQWFRKQYDDLIDRVNKSVEGIYPNKPDKLVPKRDDYYRHFQEMNAWSGLKNLFDTTSARISPSLSGLSPYTQPKSKWASFKQKRGMGEFKNDAVGGFLDYIPAASYAIHIDPHIAVFRNLAKRLAKDTDESANINNFIKFLNNFANDLSGKTSPLDRWVEEIGGRKALQIVTKLNNRVKANTILGNAGSVVAQIANIPNGLAYAGVDAIPGLARTAASLFSPNEAMAKSVFMRERYLDQSFRKFDQRWWEQPKRFAEATMEIADRIGSSITWNSAYAKGVRQKVSDPVKFADEQTRRLIGGRGVGEQPLLIKSKIFNILAPFQLEVNNQWRVMKDFVDTKAYGGLATLLVYNWIFNKLAESVRGSSVTFDPIDAIYEAATEDDINILQRTGRVGGEILSNLPLGQNLAAMYPEYGTNLYGVQLPTREGLFGEKDPTRFGEGLVITKGFQDPIFKLALPWGGNQLKKTIQGTDALVRGGSYTDTILTTGLKIEDPSLRFPVKSTPVDVARSALFGPYATSQGKEYTKQERRPLTPKQTKQYLKSNNGQKFYDDLMTKRAAAAEKLKNEKPKK